MHVLRLLVNKKLLPAKVFIDQENDHEDESKLVYSIQRGFALLKAKINICDSLGSIHAALAEGLAVGAVYREK